MTCLQVGAGQSLPGVEVLVEVLVDDALRDVGDRRYPAHLDVRETGPSQVGGDADGFRAWRGDSTPGAWGLPPRPDRTYDLARLQRDRRRRRDAGEPDPWSRYAGQHRPTTSAPEGRNP